MTTKLKTQTETSKRKCGGKGKGKGKFNEDAVSDQDYADKLIECIKDDFIGV